MYKAPIELIYSPPKFDYDGEIYKAVVKCGVSVDKDELIKALQYDRDQYDKGYADAKAEVARDILEAIKKRERSNAYCCWCVHADIYGRRAKECDEPYTDKNGKEQRACFSYAKFESYIDNLLKEITEDKP